MKFTLTGPEIQKIVSNHLQNLLQGGCEFVTTSEYDLSKDVTFVENTQEYQDAQAKEKADREAWLAKYNAEQAAKKAAAEVVEAAGRG